jgi:hypothetical protein
MVGFHMSLFRRKVPGHLVPIHPDNAAHKDWVIILEATTIIGPSPERLRVARATQERKIVKTYNFALRPKYYLDIEGFHPRIQAAYLCPQLYRYDSDKKLVPLAGEEIGRLIAQSVESGIAERRPWYEPAEKIPSQPIIDIPAPTDFDTVVVEMPNARNAVATGA